jgi:hypothetical protein
VLPSEYAQCFGLGVGRGVGRGDGVARAGVTVAPGCAVAVAVAFAVDVGVLPPAVELGVLPADDELVGEGPTVACAGGVVGCGVMSAFAFPSNCDSVCEAALLSGGVEDGRKLTASTATATVAISAPAISTNRHSRVPTPASVSDIRLCTSRAAPSVRKLSRQTRNAER